MYPRLRRWIGEEQLFQRDCHLEHEPLVACHSPAMKFLNIKIVDQAYEDIGAGLRGFESWGNWIR